MTYERALEWRRKIELASSTMPDEDAVTSPELFPAMKYEGELIKNGTRINWMNVVKRAAVDLWDTEANNPDNAPTLWEDITFTGTYRDIPEVITVGLAFMKDEIGMWKGELYKSLLDNNVYNPDRYAAGWEKV